MKEIVVSCLEEVCSEYSTEVATDINTLFLVTPLVDEEVIEKLRKLKKSLPPKKPPSEASGKGKRFSALACMSVRGIKNVELIEGGVDGDKIL